MNYTTITAFELTAMHDRLENTARGLPGTADRGKAEAAAERIAMLNHYGELPDVWHVAAAHLEAVARAHAFVDMNKRTSLLNMLVFLHRQGITLRNDTEAGDALVELTVNAATGEANRAAIAAELQQLQRLVA